MFPATHIYFYSMLFPIDPESCIGAVFPDTNLFTGLRWSQTHKNILPFYKSLSPEERENHRSFLLGFLSHGVDSAGLDLYGDDDYRHKGMGYSYIKGESLIREVVKACRIKPEMGLWKSHNIIEMGIESLIAKSNPWIEDLVNSTLKEEAIIKKCAGLVANYYKVEPSTYETAITTFLKFINTTGDIPLLGERYKEVLRIRHNIEDAQAEEIALVIQKATYMVEKEYKDFLLECKENLLLKWKEWEII